MTWKHEQPLPGTSLFPHHRRWDCRLALIEAIRYHKTDRHHAEVMLARAAAFNAIMFDCRDPMAAAYARRIDKVQKAVRPSSAQDWHIQLECLPEHTRIRDTMASGDDDLDRKEEERINNDLTAGNQWAWFCAKVTVTYKDILSAVQYLGCCSYNSEEGFKEDAYFKDMVREAKQTIIGQLIILGAPIPETT